MQRRTLTLLLALGLLGCGFPAPRAQENPPAPTRVRDVIYGRKHGVVLTLDVFRPAQPSGIGVLWMVSGGWFSSHQAINVAHARVFTDRGHTVFSVVHGSQPKYAIQEITQDIDRAVRYVRTHAAQYGVDPNRLGIAGGSAGGHLSLMQGARGGPGKSDAPDPVDRASSRVQAVACFFPPTDFLNYGEPGRNALLVEELKPFRAAFGNKTQEPDEVRRVAAEISPVTYFTREMPPTLIYHGDQDKLVPIQQAQVAVEKLKSLGVEAKLIVKEGAAHGWPTMLQDGRALAEWFETHLKKP